MDAATCTCSLMRFRAYKYTTYVAFHVIPRQQRHHSIRVAELISFISSRCCFFCELWVFGYVLMRGRTRELEFALENRAMAALTDCRAAYGPRCFSFLFFSSDSCSQSQSLRSFLNWTVDAAEALIS